MANGEEWEKELSPILTAPSFIPMPMISYLSSTAIEAGSKFGIFIAGTFVIEPFSSTSHAQAHTLCKPFLEIRCKMAKQLLSPYP